MPVRGEEEAHAWQGWKPTAQMRRDANWIELDVDAGLGLSKAGAGFKGTCVLFGMRRKADRDLLELLKAYGAAKHARIVRLDGKPKTTQITGLAFSDARHLKLVLRRLADRHFPPRIRRRRN